MNITTITDARAAIERAKAQVKAMREQGQRITVLGTHSILTAAGGAAAGALAVHMPKIGGRIDSALLIGSGLCTAAMLDIGGEYSDEMNALGAGMLAAVAARETEQMLRARAAA